MIPILDPKPAKPQDWSYNKIQEVKGVVTPSIPVEYKNPLRLYLARQDQDARGICVGESSAYIGNLNYIKLTGDPPTPEDKKQYQKDVSDPNGVTIHDILYPTSFSAECYYQKSREIGNVTYPSGSEIRFAARAMKEFGGCLEKDWITDKSARGVYLAPPDPELVRKFAEQHRIDGYAVIYGWDTIKQAIYEKGFVLGAIPVYENFSTMQGGDGTFPDPRGPIIGYHALCFYGYDADNLFLIHSWGDWCGMFGSISKKYYDISEMDEQHFMVILDSSEVKIAREQYSKLEIYSTPQAKLSVNSDYVGDTPQTISIEHGKVYIVSLSKEGYITQSQTVDDTITTLNITLERVQVGWFQRLMEWLLKLIGG